MRRLQPKSSRYVKNQGNIIPPNEQNNFPVTDSKDVEIFNLPDKELKIAL